MPGGVDGSSAVAPRPQRSVADVWGALKGQHRPAGFERVWSGLRNEGLGAARSRAGQNADDRLPAAPQRPGSASQRTKQDQEPHMLAISDDVGRSDRSDPAQSAALCAERLAQQLLDPEARVRRSALEAIAVGGMVCVAQCR